MRKVFEPSIVGLSRAVVHVTTETYLEHLERLIANGSEVFLVHFVVRVRCDFVSAEFLRHLVERRFLSERGEQVIKLPLQIYFTYGELCVPAAAFEGECGISSSSS